MKPSVSISKKCKANRLMTINGNPDYFSLNLSQAVQVVCYELFSQVGGADDTPRAGNQPATQAQIAGMVAHLESVMNDVGFFNRRNSERLMRRMQNLFARANTETEDIDILRGFLNTVKRNLK